MKYPIMCGLEVTWVDIGALYIIVVGLCAVYYYGSQREDLSWKIVSAKFCSLLIDVCMYVCTNKGNIDSEVVFDCVV